MVIQKVYEVDPLNYIKGGATLRIIAIINDTAMPSRDATWSTKINHQFPFAIWIREAGAAFKRSPIDQE